MKFITIADRLAAIDRSEVVFSSERCLHSQDRYSECELCFGICPQNAITSGKPPRFDQKACQSCFACLAVCPTGAYQADGDVPSLLTCAARIETEEVEILCGLHPEPGLGENPDCPGIQIQGCLAGLGAGAISDLFALGLQQVTLRTDACEQCPWGQLCPLIQEHAQKASDILSNWAAKPVVNCTTSLDAPIQRTLLNAKNPPLSRRDLFRLAGKQGKTALARSMETATTEKGHFLGRERSRLLAAIDHLPSPGNPGEIHLGALNFAILEVSEACTACGTCVRACPSEALRILMDEEETVFRLSQDARKCIACEVCQHVCAPAAIRIQHDPSFDQVFSSKSIVLREAELIHCQKCGTVMAKQEGVNLCPLCVFRQKNPFGSGLPPGFNPKSGQAS